LREKRRKKKKTMQMRAWYSGLMRETEGRIQERKTTR
jgi:hypothetical protein